MLSAKNYFIFILSAFLLIIAAKKATLASEVDEEVYMELLASTVSSAVYGDNEISEDEISLDTAMFTTADSGENYLGDSRDHIPFQQVEDSVTEHVYRIWTKDTEWQLDGRKDYELQNIPNITSSSGFNLNMPEKTSSAKKCIYKGNAVSICLEISEDLVVLPIPFAFFQIVEISIDIMSIYR